MHRAETLAYWAGKLYWKAESMVGKRLGRPTEYDPIDDAVLLNTFGEGEEHTNRVLDLLGRRSRTRDALTGRRTAASKAVQHHQPSGDGYERLGRIQSMRALLELRLQALDVEEEWLRKQLGLILRQRQPDEELSRQLGVTLRQQLHADDDDGAR